MAEKEISAHKGTSTFQALEGSFLCICRQLELAEFLGVCVGGVSLAHDLRERSCRLRCSLLLKARLQNWHLYFFSGAEVFLAGELLAEGAEGAILESTRAHTQEDLLAGETKVTENKI